ncbi:unnamed protein product [Adineta steineri]|uniref:Uncharacterized protein n=1 Tax=Adineta steineri TaxID=433720 RepID=A0A813U6N0_9BILA|nr:unnamed protein product [Adineta steineri]CAF0824478.1 unnamed protein product [Adineta steineri]
MAGKSNEQWACKFSKAKNAVVEVDELISRITEDHKIQKKIAEPLSINIFTTKVSEGKSTTGLNGQFVFSQILIDCLLRLKYTQTDKTEFINLCKNEYEGNHIELDNLREFEEEYSADKVLWWYTRESFFYKILNTALRTQNIHTIFLFREFISDIHCQLQHDQVTNPLRVYRSQLMSSDELHDLKQHIGQFISIQSFFSTSKNRTTALFFLGDTTSLIDLKLEGVLFEIDADPQMVTTKPFADISKYSHFINETEVLFMIGSIFRLKSINYSDDHVWIIEMSLCSDNEYDLKQVLLHMKQQIGNGETNLRTLGKVLWTMGKFDLAEGYFKRLLNELPSNDPLLSSLYEDLGELASQTGDYDMSIQWHQKYLEVKKQNELLFQNNSNITNNCIGVRWKQEGITVAGGNGRDDNLNQLSHPVGIFVDDDQTIYIANNSNHRIVQWKYNAIIGQIVAGANGCGNQMNQFNEPIGVIIDKEHNSLIIADSENRRVMQWSRQNNTKNGQIIIEDIDAWGLAMDNSGTLYVSDFKQNEVKRWKREEKTGTIVAGGNGKGSDFNQLNFPTYIFVDEDYSLYVSDSENHRVVKWLKDADKGIIVAGGQGQGNSLTQLSSPRGVIVDQLGYIYVADFGNHRIMRWCKEDTQGAIVAGGNGEGKQSNQLYYPEDLSFDRQGNLYVSDLWNHRVQKFELNSIENKFTDLNKSLIEDVIA